jgi:hypothetical protein
MSLINDIVRSPNGLLAVAAGHFEDAQAVNIFGVNPVVGTTYETLWDYGGLYSYPASAATLSAVSSSASDTMAVLISGLDAGYWPITEVVTLTGTSAVTTTQAFLRVNSAVILAGSNVGNITITNDGTVLGYISIGKGLTQACNFTVPVGHSLYLYRTDLTSGTVTNNKYLTYRNVTRSSTGRVLRVTEATWQTGEQSFNRQVPFKVAEKTDFQFEAKSASNDNEISIFVEAILVREN